MRWRLAVAFVVLVCLANIGICAVAWHLDGEREHLLQERAYLERELVRVRTDVERLQREVSPPDADPLLIPEEYSIAVVHAKPGGCGGVAWYRKPGPSYVSDLSRLPDGTKPVPLSPLICGHCGRAAWPLSERPRRFIVATAVKVMEEKP